MKRKIKKSKVTIFFVFFNILAFDMDYSRMTYSLLDPDNRNSFGTGDMPIFCGSLVNATCPLKTGQNVIYSTSFQINQSSKLVSFAAGKPLRVILLIELYGNESDLGSMLPLYRFELEISLEPCLLHVMC